MERLSLFSARKFWRDFIRMDQLMMDDPILLIDQQIFHVTAYVQLVNRFVIQ